MANAELENTVAETPQSGRGMVVKALIFGLIAVVLLFLVLALSTRFAAAPQDTSAPDFTMALYDGGEFTLSEMRGKVVVVNFWASWCAPCKEEAADLERAWQAYQGKDVQFIGVDYVDAEDKAKAYLSEFYISYPNGADLGTKISDAFHIRGVPETFIVDREGKVVFYFPNPITYERLTAEIEKVVAGTAE